MWDFVLNDVEITSLVPRAFADKLELLSEHEWMSFEPIPKINLLKGQNVEDEFLCLTYFNNNNFIFISDTGHNGGRLIDLARQYKFSFTLKYYSTFTLQQGVFSYDYLTDKLEEFYLFNSDCSGVKYHEATNTFTYEGVEYMYRQELTNYLIQRKKRMEKIDLILEDKDLYRERLPAQSGNLSNPFYKIGYAIRKLIAKYLL